MNGLSSSQWIYSILFVLLIELFETKPQMYISSYHVKDIFATLEVTASEINH